MIPDNPFRVIIKDKKVCVGDRFKVSFQRTLRLPDDGQIYPLPPGLGEFPVIDVEQVKGAVPEEWRKPGSVLIPMYEREALWLGFDTAYWKPNAVKIGIGGINAISGEEWSTELHDQPQDYIVCPDQPWVDGIKAGDGSVRQFVAVPLGLGYTIEAQLSGSEVVGGIQLLVYDPKAGLFPDKPPAPNFDMDSEEGFEAVSIEAMGMGAGAEIKQKIYPDPYGLDTWNQKEYGSVLVHIVNTRQYEELTGLAPPPTPVSAKAYAEHGLPWFELYDEGRGDIRPQEKLIRSKSISQLDAERGNAPDITGISIKDADIKRLRPGSSERKN